MTVSPHAVLAAAMLLACLVPAVARAPAPDAGQVTVRIAAQANALRQDQGLPPLRPAPRLQAAAQAFAAYMARTDRYAHDADGRRPRARAEAQGYRACVVAENIAYYFNTAGVTTDELARELFTDWRESPPHRRNLLDAELSEAGLGLARSGRTGRWYAVHLFGRPRGVGGCR